MNKLVTQNSEMIIGIGGVAGDGVASAGIALYNSSLIIPTLDSPQHVQLCLIPFNELVSESCVVKQVF